MFNYPCVITKLDDGTYIVECMSCKHKELKDIKAEFKALDDEMKDGLAKENWNDIQL